MADYCSVGKFRCKYCFEGECTFFYMGSGNMSDLPCGNRDTSDFDIIGDAIVERCDDE